LRSTIRDPPRARGPQDVLERHVPPSLAMYHEIPRLRLRSPFAARICDGRRIPRSPSTILSAAPMLRGCTGSAPEFLTRRSTPERSASADASHPEEGGPPAGGLCRHHRKGKREEECRADISAADDVDSGTPGGGPSSSMRQANSPMDEAGRNAADATRLMITPGTPSPIP